MGTGKPGVSCTPDRKDSKFSGKCLSVDRKERKVRFKEYTRLEGTWDQRRKDSKPAGQDSEEGKWIYVFRTTSKKGEILQYAEIFANSDGKYQLIDIVNPKVRKADVRKPDPKVQPKPDVKLIYEENGKRVENFFCLSHIQLPYKRVEEIRSKIEQFWSKADLKELRRNADRARVIAREGARAELIPIYSSSTHPSGFFGLDGSTSLHSDVNDEEDTATVFLTDHLTEALRLHERFIDLRDQYLEWERDLQGYSYLVHMVYELTYPKEKNSDKRKEDTSLTAHIKKEEFLTAREKHLEEEKRQRDAIDSRASQLCEWIDSNDFKAVQLDYESGAEDLKKKGEELYQKVIERLHESRRGQLYLFLMYSQQESWMNKYLFSDARKPHEAFWHILTDITAAILNVEIARNKKKGSAVAARRAAREELKKIVNRRRSDLRWTETKVPIEIKREITLGERARKREEVMKLGVQKTAATAEALAEGRITRPIPDGLQNAVSAFNLLLKINALFESKTPGELAKNIIGLAAAIVGQIVSSSAFCERLAKRFAEKGVKKMARVVGFITGLIDAVTGIWDIADQAEQGNFVAMSGAAVAVAGAIAGAVGMFMLKGAVAGAAVPPVAIALVIGGIIAELIGLLIFLFCSYDDLKYWLRHCEWGKVVGDPDKPRDWAFGCEEPKPYPTISLPREKIFMSWPENYQKQICALHNILFDFKMRVRYFNKTHTKKRVNVPFSLLRMTIEPSFVTEYSKLTLFASVTDKGGHKFSLTPTHIVLRKDFVWLEEERSGSDTRIKSITVEWFDENYVKRLRKIQNRSEAVGMGITELESKIEKVSSYIGWHKGPVLGPHVYINYAAKLDVYGDGKCVIPTFGEKRGHLLLDLDLGDVMVPGSYNKIVCKG